MKKSIIKNIPNLLTLTSLFLGFSSILASLQSLQDLLLHSKQNSVDANPARYLTYAGLFIVFGCFLDSLDGIAARLLKVTSPIGKALDSFSDLVTFGIAPGVLFYTVTLFAGETIPDSGIAYDIANIIPDFLLTNLFLVKLFAFLFPITVVIRLARFNAREEKDYFEGMPSTYAGGMMALMFTFNFHLTPAAKIFERLDLLPPNFFQTIIYVSASTFGNFLFLIIVYFLLSMTMILPIRFYKIQYYIKRRPTGNQKIAILIFIFLIISYFKYTLLIMGLLYCLHSIFKHFYFIFNPEKARYSR